MRLKWHLWRHWLAVALWLLVIFGASSDSNSSRRSSRIIGPIVRWLYPSISDPALERVVWLVRKAAHVTEYAVLAVLLWRALRRSRPEGGWSWNARLAAVAWCMATAYAASDEYHQTWVAGRTGQWQDVLLDSSGAALGVGLLWLWCRSRPRPAAPP